MKCTTRTACRSLDAIRQDILISQWLTRPIFPGRNAEAITAARSAKSACIVTTRYRLHGKCRDGRTLTSYAGLPSTTLCGAAITFGGILHPEGLYGINATEKYDWLFQRYASPGMRVLDTHLGSGSSRIAAYKAGLDFVGVEIDPTYYKAAEDRFADYTAQTSLWEP